MTAGQNAIQAGGLYSWAYALLKAAPQGSHEACPKSIQA